MLYEPVVFTDEDYRIQEAGEGKVFTDPCVECGASVKKCIVWCFDLYCIDCSDKGKEKYRKILEEVRGVSHEDDEEYWESRRQYRKEQEFYKLLDEYDELISQIAISTYNKDTLIAVKEGRRQKLWEFLNEE